MISKAGYPGSARWVRLNGNPPEPCAPPFVWHHKQPRTVHRLQVPSCKSHPASPHANVFQVTNDLDSRHLSHLFGFCANSFAVSWLLCIPRRCPPSPLVHHKKEYYAFICSTTRSNFCVPTSFHFFQRRCSVGCLYFQGTLPTLGYVLIALAPTVNMRCPAHRRPHGITPWSTLPT